jgi:glyoxylase-like metal-dependent hydrolase (beta-lactamase superfamily II)
MTVTHLCRPLMLMLAALCMFVAAAAQSAPKQQVPGYFRIKVGEATVTALYDGYIALPAKAFKNVPDKHIRALYEKSFLDPGKGEPTAVNAFLIDDGGRRILVDAGTRDCFGPTMGGLPGSLRAAGYAPGDIDAVLITHMHGDHVCGLIDGGGKAVFPRAIVWAAEEEAAYWLDETRPDAGQSGFRQARDAFAPYRATGAFHTFKSGAELFPGIRAIATHGHTPGHTSFLLSSKGENLLIWGDIMHVAAVQFARPEATILSDIDPKQAAAARKAMFEAAVKNGWSIAGVHLPFPGIGRIRKDGGAYAFVPVEYGPLK